MHTKNEIEQFKKLNSWFDTPLGITVSEAFLKELSPTLSFLHGNELLQIGICANNEWLSSMNYQTKWVASPFPVKGLVDVTCSLMHLPLNRSSVDCVIAPFTLESFTNHLALIDEIDRVLKPMGLVIILGINPFSLWGLASKFKRFNNFLGSPIKMHTPFQINRIFIQRGYHQCLLSNFCYIPPINHEKTLKKLSILNEVGKILWPFPAGLYCYIAQKYEPMSPSLLAVERLQEASLYKPFLQPAV